MHGMQSESQTVRDLNHQPRDMATEFAQMIEAILVHVEAGDMTAAGELIQARDSKLRLLSGRIERATLLTIIEQDRQLVDAIETARSHSANALTQFRRSRTATRAYAQNQTIPV